MAQVSTQAELAAAIATLDPNIQIAADFSINTQQTIRYSALIASAEGSVYTLTKANGYDGTLFEVQGGGSLTLQNITLDGAQESHSQAGSSLVEALSGTLILDTGTVLQNNYARQGGGVAVNDSAGTPVTVLIQGNAAIRNNRSLDNGGGIYVNYQLPDSGLELSGQALVEGNTSGESGGGVYSAEGTSRIIIRGGSEITDNSAASGGGIYHVSEQILSLEGVTITQNTAGTGQGLYNDGPLELGPMAVIPDRIYLPDQDAIPTIVTHLSWNSVVQLERSGYVTPSQDGTPIVVARSDLELVGEDAVVFRTPPTGFTGWRFRVSDDRHQVLLTPAEYHLFYENTLGVENPNPNRYTEFTPTIPLLPLANTPGSLFLGWYDAAEGGNQVTQISTGSTGDKTLYAHWQAVEYTVTYYGNDTGGPAAGNVPPPQRVQGGESAVLSDGRPTREGFVFTSWNTDPAGMGTAYLPGGTIPGVLADTGLYAQWKALPPVMRMLTYHGNDAGGPPVQSIPGPTVVLDGQDITLSHAVPIREGFAFSGWNTNPAGTGSAYQPGDTVPDVRADIDLYAQWTPLPPACHTLTYCGNDAGGPPARRIPGDQCVPAGQCVRVSCRPPCRACYCFAGWSTDPYGSGRMILPGQVVGPVMWDICLYAQWRRLPPSKPRHFYRCEPD